MATPSIHVIACGVLAVDLRQVIQELQLDIRTTYLPGGLHNNPKELRRRLQAAIDEVSADPQVGQIAIGYGICGRGTVGLHARHVPLAIPRVHDCIALFLGSDAAYRREFARYPGTYYVSAGWVREKVQPSGSQPAGDDPACRPPIPVNALPAPPSAGDPTAAPAGCPWSDPELQGLVARHGAENAQAIQHFLSSWQRNYQRAAFIDTGTPEHRRYAQVAADMAARYGWKFEELPGSTQLLKKLITCQSTDQEVLWVPPHHVTDYDPVGRGLQAVPVWKLDQASGPAGDQIIEVGSDHDRGPQARLGLGIDAGGTYTDAVIYEFAADKVVAKAKALTTPWDYTLGISSALDQLEAGHLRQVDLVSISTTLATNAVVEGRGQKVGLVIMPPYGLFAPEDIAHRPIAVIRGQMEIDGVERVPIDPDEILRVARQMVEQEQVGAFAVTGFASHVNPGHELEVRRILEEETGLPVTCGHDVSEQLNYRVRAQTAALNGRIIPILVSFLQQAAQSLATRGITAPMMVVRSDGSLMSVEAARQRPIETILSGPAASVAGARHLAQAPSAFVVDVGGTTTDTALILNGSVRTASQGARVGGWQTHVQALDLRTCGLGGDSLIASLQGKLHIGPRRVGPMAWLGARQPSGLEPCFQWIQEHLDHYATMPALLDIYTLNGRPTGITLSPRQQRIVEALARRPYSAHELAAGILEHWWEDLDLERLEGTHLVQRCGLTPTDLLHATGRFERWDTSAARRMLALMSQALNISPDRLVAQVHEQFVRRLALEVLKKQLDDDGNVDGLEGSELARTLVDNWLKGGSAGYHVRIQLQHPIIGIGAPVGHFLPAAAELLQTRAIIPEHADVANALGAITSSVVLHRQVEICPDMHGRYAVHGLPGAPTFAELHEARAAAMEHLQQYIRAAARAAGTRRSRIQFILHDKVAPLGDGGQIFIAQTVEARLTGRPDLARLAQA